MKTSWRSSAMSSITHENEEYSFVSLSQHSGTGEWPQATIVFTAGGKEFKASSDGNGPVDNASLKGIETHVKSGAEMVLYSVNAISGSTESQGEVTVRLQNSGRVVNGVGAAPRYRGGFGQGISECPQQVTQQS